MTDQIPTLHPLLIVLRAFRNGAYYGTKIRAPHALVMTILFQSGTLAEKIKSVIALTYTHTKNLAIFAGVYKAILFILRQFYIRHGLVLENPQVGQPAADWHAALAGGIGGYIVWSKYSGVNYQIVMYLLSRIAIALVKVLAKKGISPFAKYDFKTVYPLLATGVWAVVMWLFEKYPNMLHHSLEKSMQFLYHESNQWKNGVTDFLPSPATAVVCCATWLQDFMSLGTS